MRCRCGVYRKHPDLGLCRRCHAARQRRRAAREGWDPGTPLVPRGEVRAHVDMLRASGMGLAAIEAASGVGQRQLRHVYNSAAGFSHASTAARILAVEVPPLPIDSQFLDGAVVAGRGSIRRLQSLCAMGYTQNDLAGATGMSLGQINCLVNERVERVLARNARKIDRVWHSLQASPPVMTTARKRCQLRAQRKGWPVPFLWDVESIDNPLASPCGMVEDGDWFDRYSELSTFGRDEHWIAEKMGLEFETLRLRLKRRAFKNDESCNRG